MAKNIGSGSIDETPLEYVIRHNWEYKLTGGEIEIKGCPLCHNQKWNHFFLNQNTGQWNCKICGKNGNLFTLKQELKEIIPLSKGGCSKKSKELKPLNEFELQKVYSAHEALLNSNDYLQQLISEWNVSIETIKRCKLGIAVDFSPKNGKDVYWITIPQFMGGELFDIKYRSWFGATKDFKHVKGASSILYNQDVLNENPYYVLVSEGERDAITLVDKGFKNVIGTTGGAGTFREEWWLALQGTPRIFLVFDSDKAGKEGAKTVASRLGLHRCYNVTLPEDMDVSEFLQEHSSKEFGQLLKNSQLFNIDYVLSLKEVLLNELNSSEEKEEVFSTGYYSLDKILNGGFRRPELITLSAPAKSLKTTLAWDIATYHALVSKQPVLFLCMEMPPFKLTKLLISKMYHVDRDKDIDKTMIYKALLDLGGTELYLGFFTKITFEQVCETIRESYKRFGTRFVVFDNIHFLARGCTNKVEEVENIMKGFVEIKNEIDGTIIVIAQPKKMNVDKEMNYYDISWSGAFASDSDTILILFRKRVKSQSESFSPYLMVKVDAGRYTKGGRTILKTKQDLPTFEEVPKNELSDIIKTLYVKEEKDHWEY